MGSRLLATLDLSATAGRQLQSRRVAKNEDLVDRDPIFGVKACAEPAAPDNLGNDDMLAVTELDVRSLSDRLVRADQQAPR